MSLETRSPRSGRVSGRSTSHEGGAPLKQDKNDLLALILHAPPEEERALTPAPGKAVSQHLKEKAYTRADFAQWFEALQGFLPEEEDEELSEYYQFALMGLVVGFGDRHLSPYLEEHTAIIPPLLEDIHAVYTQAKASDAEYKRQDFLYRAFDYGIHKAYYLDWSLYISKDMY